MKFKVAPGLSPQEVTRPNGDWMPVPQGFRDALVIARRFTGKRHQLFPEVQFVYLVDGMLYASDNRCIVEIDLKSETFGRARFTAGDVATLKAMPTEPSEATFRADEMAFSWLDDGSWCRFDTEASGFDLADKCRSLLNQFWHEGPDIATLDTLTGWHEASIKKVTRVAETFDPGVTPAPFSFPNGRGLIVKPSPGRIKP